MPRSDKRCYDAVSHVCDVEIGPVCRRVLDFVSPQRRCTDPRREGSALNATNGSSDAGRLHLTLSTDSHGSCTESLRAHLDLAPSPLDELVVDFAGCNHLEAEAVDALGAVLDRAVDNGATISMQGITPNIRVILGIAGLLDFDDAPPRNGD